MKYIGKRENNINQGSDSRVDTSIKIQNTKSQ